MQNRAQETSTLRVQRYSGQQIIPYLPELARLRIEVFREFPYLYLGTLATEETYLRVYADSPESVLVLAFDEHKVVGCSTGVPMSDETDAVQRPFLQQGLDPAQIFYFGESVLSLPYRGQGIGVRFFEEREAHARALKRFDLACFCAVERPADHPQRPADYQPLDMFWRKRGFEKQPQLMTAFDWQEPGETTESPKPLVFWTKALA